MPTFVIALASRWMYLSNFSLPFQVFNCKKKIEKVFLSHSFTHSTHQPKHFSFLNGFLYFLCVGYFEKKIPISGDTFMCALVKIKMQFCGQWRDNLDQRNGKSLIENFTCET
jgi:hypothetical protein